MNKRLEAELLRRGFKTAKPMPPKKGTWGRLSTPVEAEETMRRIRAQSLMTGWIEFKDSTRNAGTLSLAEAETVLAYFKVKV